MKIGILGAMLEEVSGIIESLDRPQKYELGNREFWEGRWRNVDIVVAFSRWGKVASATTTAFLIERFKVDQILFIGVAGAADERLRLADIVVADSLLQHDMDASAIPAFQRFEIPLLGRIQFETSPSLLKLARRAAQAYVDADFQADISAEDRAMFSITEPEVTVGLIASGDRFISDSADVKGLRELLPELLCVEMEGAAVAQVCYEMSIPVAVIRIISDRADQHAPIDFPRFTASVASIMGRGIAGRFLDQIAAQAGVTATRSPCRAPRADHRCSHRPRC